jgi:hypothetical protein
MDFQAAQLASSGRHADGVITRQPNDPGVPFWQPLHLLPTSCDHAANDFTLSQNQFSFSHSLNKVQIMGRNQNTDAYLIELAEQIHNFL